MRFTIVDSVDGTAKAVDCPGSAFWIVLEKFGFLDYQTKSFEEFISAHQDLPSVGIIPNAVARALRPEQFSKLRELGKPALVEGPLDHTAGEIFGLHIADVPPHRSASVEIRDPSISDAVEFGLSGMSTPSNSGAFTQLSNLTIGGRPRRPHGQSKVTSAFAQINVRAAQALEWALPQISLTGAAPQTSQILCARSTDGARWPLVFRQGSLIVSTFAILTYVLEDYTSPYLRDVYEFSNDRYPIEFILITLLRRALTEVAEGASGLSVQHGNEIQSAILRLRVAPWPRGAQTALCIRHDVDRIPTPQILNTLLAAQAAKKVGVTACFLGRTAAPDVVKAFADNGAEIAYHAEYLEPSGRQELAKIADVKRGRVYGCSVHGNAGFYGWRGVANWEAYQQMGFTYAENLSSMRYLPSRFFKFDDDGNITTYPFVGLPHHFSFERNKIDNFRGRLASATDGISRNEVCMIVLNHPDIHVDDLVAFMRTELPADRVDLTIKEIADWWRISHTTDSLRYQIVRAEKGLVELELDSREDVPGLTFEIEGHVAVDEVTLTARAMQDQAGRKLSHASRHSHNALAGNCTRLWFDVPPGHWQLSLAYEPAASLA